MKTKTKRVGTVAPDVVGQAEDEPHRQGIGMTDDNVQFKSLIVPRKSLTFEEITADQAIMEKIHPPANPR
jgi:hypothetical protein